MSTLSSASSSGWRNLRRKVPEQPFSAACEALGLGAGWLAGRRTDSDFSCALLTSGDFTLAKRADLSAFKDKMCPAIWR